MATLRDWINHFKKLDGPTRQGVHKALKTLSDDLMFQKHYGSDLSNLSYALDSADRERREEV